MDEAESGTTVTGAHDGLLGALPNVEVGQVTHDGEHVTLGLGQATPAFVHVKRYVVYGSR